MELPKRWSTSKVLLLAMVTLSLVGCDYEPLAGPRQPSCRIESVTDTTVVARPDRAETVLLIVTHPVKVCDKER